MITLKTLYLATQQEVFDQAAEHLLLQNKKAEIFQQRRKCKYLLKTETEILKCAVGCFISDDEYNPEFESNSVYSILGGLSTPNPHKHIALLNDLREVHDYFAPDMWKERLQRLADRYDLIFNI